MAARPPPSLPPRRIHLGSSFVTLGFLFAAASLPQLCRGGSYVVPYFYLSLLMIGFLGCSAAHPTRVEIGTAPASHTTFLLAPLI